MNTYISTKTVQARPVTLQEAEEILNRPITGQSEESGYLIQYKDGYTSYCPKTVFERDYKPADTPLDRLKIEYKELEEREQKLNTFVNGKTGIRGYGEEFMKLDNEAQCLLTGQLDAMARYKDILLRRIGKIVVK